MMESTCAFPTSFKIQHEKAAQKMGFFVGKELKMKRGFRYAANHQT